MKRTSLKPKLYEVEWQDAWSNDLSWQGLDLADMCAETAINRTVGWMMKRNKKQIVLAQSIHADDERCSSLTGIPLGCILKMRKLK